MEDYLDEKEQWERLLAWLRDTGPWMLATVVLVLAGFGGWRYWQARRERVDLAAAARYELLLDAVNQGQLSFSTELADDIVKGYPSTPYADQAELLAAHVAVANNQLPQAAVRLSYVAQHSHDTELRLLARLRLARVQLAERRPDEALQTLAAVQPGAFAGRYAEVRGDALLAKGDKAGALQAYLAARSGGDTLDTELLDLKIDDLAHS